MTREEAESLLFREARLLDERRFDEWLAMFTEDCLYWIPTIDGDPAAEPSIVYDDRQRLEERIFRVAQTRAYAQRPRSRTQHNISNVEVHEAASDGAVEVHEADAEGAVEVLCNLLLVELREGDAAQAGLGYQRLLAARCRYVFVAGPEWRIRLKKLTLIDRDLPHHNLSFVL